MKISLIHNARLPVDGYGGTERLVWWLAKALHERGHSVELVCRPDSRCPFAKIREWEDFMNPYDKTDSDLVHYFYTPSTEPKKPYLVTIGGNGTIGEKYWQNTVFVSRNMAIRHHAEAFVHNGVDPEEYVYREKKKDYFAFCAKASWKVKNVKAAIQVAKHTGKELHILGGKRFFNNPFGKIKWHGMQGGDYKAEILSHASLFLFPVRWNEPFGIAMVEALLSGTPVLGTPFGSLPEVITNNVGKICHSLEELVEATQYAGVWKAKTCREYAMEHFHYQKMAEKYEKYYDAILSSRRINPFCPYVDEDTGGLLSFPQKSKVTHAGFSAQSTR